MSTHDEVRQQLSEAISAAVADLEHVASSEERYQGASWLVDQLANGITAAGKLRGRAATCTTSLAGARVHKQVTL